MERFLSVYSAKWCDLVGIMRPESTVVRIMRIDATTTLVRIMHLCNIHTVANNAN